MIHDIPLNSPLARQPFNKMNTIIINLCRLGITKLILGLITSWKLSKLHISENPWLCVIKYAKAHKVEWNNKSDSCTVETCTHTHTQKRFKQFHSFSDILNPTLSVFIRDTIYRLKVIFCRETFFFFVFGLQEKW